MSSDERDTIELHSGAQVESGDGGAVDGHLAPTDNYSTVYETKYQKSLRHYLTREALPKEAHYRNLDSIVDGSARPTMDDLHNNTFRGEQVSQPKFFSNKPNISNSKKHLLHTLIKIYLSILF